MILSVAALLIILAGTLLFHVTRPPSYWRCLECVGSGRRAAGGVCYYCDGTGKAK